MTKTKFLKELKSRLVGLPAEDIERSLDYYSEMIDDMVEDGKSEKEAIESLGGMDEVVNNVLAETPIAKIVKEKVKPKHELKTWEVVLIILGAPLWITLLLVALLLCFAVFCVIWSIVISFYIVGLSFACVAIACFFAIITGVFPFSFFPALGLIGVSIAFVGLTVLWIVVSVLVTKLAIRLGELFILGIKRLFIGKDNK